MSRMLIKPILRHSVDWLPVLYILTIFSVHMMLFFWVSNIIVLSVMAVVLIPFLGPSLAFNHNHHHNLTFNYSWLNRLFETILFFESGATPFAWTIHHNIGHHPHYLDRQRDSLKWNHRNGKRMSRLAYGFYNAIMMYPTVFRLGREHPHVYKKFLLMFFINMAILLAFFIYNPVNALIIILFPIAAMLFFTADGEYPHHTGLSTENDFVATRTVVNKLYNIFYFNLGYHTAHHLKPSLHWSKLPLLHEEIVGQIPTHLIYDKDRDLADLPV